MKRRIEASGGIMECFRIDESGYTGFDLLNVDQRFQGAAAIAIDDDDAARLIREHLPRVQLRAVRADEDIEVAAIAELVVAIPLGRVFHFEFLEGHWGYHSFRTPQYPLQYPQKQIDVPALRGTRRHVAGHADPA